jgi:mono/diheme cytochrome c family protein
LNSRFTWLLCGLWLGACAGFDRGDPAFDEPVPDAGEADGDRPADFAAAHSVLIDRCGGCHTQGGAAATPIALTGEPADDHETIVAHHKPNDPGTSRLLSKARGEGHGGGPVLDRNSPDYVTLRDWIAAGAPP